MRSDAASETSVRQFNTSVDGQTLDSILTSLSELLDYGLLTLRPGKSGDIVVPHIKGILGLMVAVKHLRDTVPSGFARLVLSLDSDEARRWLHLHDNDDNSRSDLLVIDGADGQFTATIVEVKARQHMAAEHSVTDGIVNGPCHRPAPVNVPNPPASLRSRTPLISC